MNNLTFFLQSLKNLKATGTIMPCSKASAQKLVFRVNFQKAKCIVELGGGTGVVTKEILGKMRSDAKLFVFESNPLFCQILTKLNDPRMVVVNDLAENLLRKLREQNIGKVDYIVSTLPLAIMPQKNKGSILRAINASLVRGGQYMQIQYSLSSFWELKQRFTNVRLDFTPWNLPPAFMYVCEPKRLAKRTKLV